MARWLALIAITQQISCGGGASQNSQAGIDPPPPVSVGVSPQSAQIAAGASLLFTATVQNASNAAINWQVNGIPGGNSLVGTIIASSATTATYTAPASVSSALTVTVQAVLQADATKSASASITIAPLPGAQISVFPANASVADGASLQFNANVQNGPPAVVWEVNNVPGGTAIFGTISSSGFYTAPLHIPNPPVVTITAFLFNDSSVSGSTTLTIVPPLPSVSISPSTANIPTNGTLQFSAAVQNSTGSVIWQVNGVTGGTSSAGTIDATGNYTAPANVPSPPTVTISAVLQTSPPVVASAGVTVVAPNAFTGVYSWRNDNSLTGQNAQETILTPASVSSTTGPIFGKLAGCPVDGAIFAQPLYVANVTTASGSHNVVYVATEHDTVYAFDDGNLCNTLWQVSLLNPASGETAVPAIDIPGQTDIVPEIGITGTPVIDPTGTTLYVVAKSRAIVNGVYVYKQELHALDVATGTEKFGGPAIIRATSAGIAFDPLYENQRSALLLAGGNIYVAFDSYSGSGSFHGWLFAYNAADLQSAPAVFNSTPNGFSGGIGESGAAPSSDASGNVFVVTSDGTFDANSNGSDYAESLLKLQINAGSFSVIDSFTPSNQAALNFSQKPFGSTGVLLLPASAGGALPLAIAGNQAGNLYLLNRASLGGFNGPNGPDNIVQTLCLTATGASGAPASIQATPAYWAANNRIYFAAAFDNLKSFALANGTFSSQSCPAAAIPNSQSTDIFDFFGNSFGASPVISWDGNNASSGIVWALDTSGYTTPAPAILHAYDATNLGNELYMSPSSGTGAAGFAVKFAVPTVANGKVYVGTQNELSVFGLH